jgi:hypothetical protein
MNTKELKAKRRLQAQAPPVKKKRKKKIIKPQHHLLRMKKWFDASKGNVDDFQD